MTASILNKHIANTLTFILRNPSIFFSEADIQALFYENLKGSNNKYLTPDYIFEFGTDKSAKSLETLKDHSRKDIEKLQYANKLGYL
jgi:hypothetical protein